jgi:hypothetical protein
MSMQKWFALSRVSRRRPLTQSRRRDWYPRNCHECKYCERTFPRPIFEGPYCRKPSGLVQYPSSSSMLEQQHDSFNILVGLGETMQRRTSRLPSPQFSTLISARQTTRNFSDVVNVRSTPNGETHNIETSVLSCNPNGIAIV